MGVAEIDTAPELSLRPSPWVNGLFPQAYEFAFLFVSGKARTMMHSARRSQSALTWF
jgi:hypothetical protein